MSADIDIDMPDRAKVLELIQHTSARQVVNGKVKKHNSGIYVTDIPQDVVNACASIDYESADSSFLPSMQIPLDAEGAQKVFELIDAIEELDDVQNVYSNFDVSDEVMASLS